MNMLQENNWLLSVGTFLPLLGVVVLLLTPKASDQMVKLVALVTSIATLAVGVYTAFKFEVKSLDYTSLVDETVIFTGKNRNKSFKGTTNDRGILIVYLPKGDEYSINFLYNKNFAMKDIPFSKGTSQASSNIQYIGTKEILRRKK